MHAFASTLLGMVGKRIGLVLGVALAAMLALPAAARASGYHPGFDRAVKEADWIILHEVISDHEPKDKLHGIPTTMGKFVGRVFLVRVKRSFKGPYRPGDLLYIWDTAHRSTASYFLTKGRDNLTFLIKPSRRKYLVTVDTHDQSKHVAVPIRNLTGAFGKGRALDLRGWLRLLDLTHVGARPIPKRELRDVLRTAKSPMLIRYALLHWQGPLTKADVRLVKSLLRRKGVQAGVSSAALDLLRKSGVALSAGSLRDQILRGPKHARRQLLKQVTKHNVAAVREQLWGWAQRDEPSGVAALQLLARLQRPYLVAKLKRHRLPFWIDIPALAAVGKPLGRTYSPAAMKLNQWQLYQAGQLVKGKTFGAAYSLQTRPPEWIEMIKLVMPLLPSMQPGARELAIAVARTRGFTVRRTGKAARLGKRGRVPVTLTVHRVAGTHRLRVTTRVRRPLLMCHKTLKRIALAQGRNRVTSTDSTLGAWHNTAAPRGCFKRRAGTVHTEVVDISSLVKNIKTPGTYQVSVDLLYPHSGSEHGLDAWTGMAYSNRVSIQLP